MKFNFRKISAIAASALMTGMTMGVAAAANYPAPFVSGGVANVAVVYGTGAGVSSLDLVQANNIQDSLAKFVSGGSVVVEGGESFVLEKASKKFHLGDSLTTIYSSLDDGELKNFLADGTYKDGDVDEDYEQTITLSNKDLKLFSDREYNNKEPTFGFVWNSGAKILEYKIKFDSEIPWGEINETDIPIMDKTFYVISAKKGEMVILDSAEKVVLAEGDSVTVGGKTVSIEYIEQNAVKFNVDGQITKTLDDHDFAELSDGSYIVANDVMFASKESGISKVEFSIGAGQLTLSDGQEIESNKNAIDGLKVVFNEGGDSATGLTALTLEWYADDKTFLTEENALTMPAPFDSIRLVFDGLDFPSSSEKITIEPGDQITIEMENYNLPFIWWDDSGVGSAHFGEDGYPLKLATADSSKFTPTLENGFEVKKYDRILVTLMDNDLSDIETGHFEVTKIDYTADNDFTVTIKDLISGKTITFEDELETEEFGEIDIKLVNVTKSGTDGYAYLNFNTTTSGATIKHNVIVSETGLMVTLPTSLAVDMVNTGVDIEFREQNKDGDVGQGSVAVTATVVADATDDVLYVASHTATPSFETESKSKIHIAYLESDLASKVTLDKSGTDNVLEIEYYGEEVPAKVMVVGGDATVSGGTTSLGNILVKDTEVSSVATKNLIVVGGSCINSAAAALVGGTKCGASWTEATGVGQGQFLIKGYADSTLTTGLALLVAGYDADDTVKATTYLTNKVVDTSKALKGTSSTLVAVEIEEA